MKHPIVVAAVSALLAVLFAVLGLMPNLGAGEPPRRKIALVLDTDIGVNSAVIAQGARLAAREFKVDLEVNALSRAEKPEKQLGMVQAAVDGGASAVLLVPANVEIAGDAIRLCERQGANLVLLDACEAYRGKTPYVGTNHMASGMKAVQTLLRISGAKQFLILYGENEIQAERLVGAKRMAEGAGALAVALKVPAAGPRPSAASVWTLLTQYPDAGAVLCLDGALTECAAQQIQSLGKKDELTLAGFDCDQTQLAYFEDGSVRFTVLRKPLAVGYEGLARAMERITWNSEIPVKYVDAQVVMREDILKPENVRLMFPLID